MRTVSLSLYSFDELPFDTQERIARRWLHLAQAYGSEEPSPQELTLGYARECLLTDPEEKYTWEGDELHVA